jgi:hypothetical protein
MPNSKKIRSKMPYLLSKLIRASKSKKLAAKRVPLMTAFVGVFEVYHLQTLAEDTIRS